MVPIGRSLFPPYISLMGINATQGLINNRTVGNYQSFLIWICWLCKMDKCVFDFLKHWLTTYPGVSWITHTSICFGGGTVLLIEIFVCLACSSSTGTVPSFIFHILQLLFRRISFLYYSRLKKKTLHVLPTLIIQGHIVVFFSVVLTLKSKVKKIL